MTTVAMPVFSTKNETVRDNVENQQGHLLKYCAKVQFSLDSCGLFDVSHCFRCFIFNYISVAEIVLFYPSTFILQLSMLVTPQHWHQIFEDLVHFKDLIYESLLFLNGFLV